MSIRQQHPDEERKDDAHYDAEDESSNDSVDLNRGVALEHSLYRIMDRRFIPFENAVLNDTNIARVYQDSPSFKSLGE